MREHLRRGGDHGGEAPAAPGRNLPDRKSIIGLAEDTSCTSPQHQKFLALLSTLMMFSDWVSVQHTAGLMQNTERVLSCSTGLVHLPDIAQSKDEQYCRQYKRSHQQKSMYKPKCHPVNVSGNGFLKSPRSHCSEINKHLA